jgi:hypothetical protein
LSTERGVQFGSDPLYVQMINALPITAATAVLFDRDYVKHEYPSLIGSRSSVEMAWRGYTISIGAIVDANAAWGKAQELVTYELDSGSSKSQVFYWISQMPGFNVTIDPKKGHTSSNRDEDLTSVSCDRHLACIDQGLSGQCCPTLEDVFLGCCNSHSGAAPTSTRDNTNSTAETTSDTGKKLSPSSLSDGSTSVYCESHPACTDLGLTGQCCPTGEGVLLGCCS